ncbi:hypothetical protein [Sphingomonas sp. LHG3406-1]|uniref:hypothetical protein n=1 Tax=Sphingomonas sp. LHG3406-1 TaxID=2804617 RepID=UPI002621500E|nr:hypothetical protein [Sphingomonas sp. LHG3406-1]
MTASAAKQTGLGLGVFSLALGAAEIFAPERIARALGLDEHGTAKTVIRAFGFREVAAGVMLLRGPAVSFNAWNRVLGDTMDTAALLAGLRMSKRPGAILGSLALVGACAALDRWTASALDEETGEVLPLDKGQSDISGR